MADTSTKNVAVVVLNWNGLSDTKKCIESLLMQSYQRYKIVVVDNHSSDHSLAGLRTIEKKYPDQITVLANPENKGFAGGVNTGIRYAIDHDLDAVALLNPDAVADKDWLKNLVDQLKQKSVGIVTSLLLHLDGQTIDSTGEFYSRWGLAFPRSRNDPVDSAPPSGPVFGATGGATLYRTALLKDIGLFDESFFMYYEDVDISFRAQLAGWKVIYTNQAIAYHKRGASTKKVPGLAVHHTFKNLPLVFIKDVPGGLCWKVGIRLYTVYIFMLAKAIVRGNGGPALSGALKSIILTPGALINRHHIQKNRRVSANDIARILYPDLPPEQTGMRRLRGVFTGR